MLPNTQAILKRMNDLLSESYVEIGKIRQFDQCLKTFFKKSLALDIWCVIIAKRSLQITNKQQPK